jgi:hypothetical protein
MLHLALLDERAHMVLANLAFKPQDATQTSLLCTIIFGQRRAKKVAGH